MKPRSKKVRIAVHGAGGKMGRRLLALLPSYPGLELAAALAGPGDRCVGEEPDVIVDFSTAEAVASRIPEWSRLRRTALLVGTTALTPSSRRALARIARRRAVLVAPNTSLGVNVLLELASRAVRRLPGWDAGIVEVHHTAKRDAPSGTALALEAASGRRIPIQSLRLGDVVGEHTLVLAGPCERLELSHRAHSRDAFARGALVAARWLSTARPGMHRMADVLGL